MRNTNLSNRVRRALVGTILGIGLLAILGTNEASGYAALPNITGARITAVRAYSPASWYGLEVGDTIVAIDGQPVRMQVDVPRLLANRSWVLLTVRDVRTSRYVDFWVPPSYGRLGVLFVMSNVPEVMLPRNR